MKIQLIYASSSASHIGEEYLGINRIYAHLTDKKFECVLTELHYDIEITQQITEIDLDCDYFGFSIFSDSARFIFKIAQYIKVQKPTAIVFFGSVFATNCWQLIFNDCKNVDFVVLGNGERPIEKFLNDYLNTNSLSYAVSINKNIVSPKSYKGKIECKENINDLVLPSRKMLKNKNKIIASVITKHGCAGNCSFCSVKEKNSFRSAHSIFDEIISIYESTGIRFFNINDPSFEDFGRMGKNIINKLCDLLIQYGVQFSFRCFVRADSFSGADAALLKKMKEVGFNNIFVGIESGNASDLIIYKKRATLQNNCDTLNLFDDLGMDYKYGFIMINPYSTTETLKENYDFLTSFKCSDLSAYINRLEVYYNSDIYLKLKNENLLAEDYCYIDNLYGYHFIDTKVANIVTFIKDAFNDELLMRVTSDYHNFQYMLSYMSPILKEEIDDILNSKKYIDAQLFKAHRDFFKYIYVANDIAKAKEKLNDYKQTIIKIQLEAKTNISKLLKKYMRFQKI